MVAPAKVKKKSKAIVKPGKTTKRSAARSKKVAARELRFNVITLATATVLLLVVQSLFVVFPKAGIYLNALALLSLLAMAVLRTNLRNTLISFAILPTLNMVLAALHYHDGFTATLVFDSILFATSIVYVLLFNPDRLLAKPKRVALGRVLPFTLMIVIGEGIGTLSYIFLRHHYVFSGTPLPIVFPIVIGLAFSEELFVRALIQRQAMAVIQPWLAAIIAAALFMAPAAANVSWLSLPGAAILSSVLAYVYYKTQNLALTIVLNATAKLTYVGLIAAFILR